MAHGVAPLDSPLQASGEGVHLPHVAYRSHIPGPRVTISEIPGSETWMVGSVLKNQDHKIRIFGQRYKHTKAHTFSKP